MYLQTAALPLRRDDKGRLRVLMVSSRDTGRWVMPKGWLMNNRKPWDSAAIEALEEAGALGEIASEPIGEYRYFKRIGKKNGVDCLVTVYPMIVAKLKRNWKERHERKRRWFSLRKAAKLVDERDLAQLLLGLADDPAETPLVRKLLKAS